MSESYIQFLTGKYEGVASKVKSISQDSKDAILSKTDLPEFDDNLLLLLIDKIGADHKPIVISTTLKLIDIFVKTQDVQKYYYRLIPAISEKCLEIKDMIRNEARKCLEDMYNSVNNKDLTNLIPYLIETVYEPEKTAETIDKVSGTKFVTIVTAGTVSILCPLLIRGYNINKDSISRLCSKIVVNMLKLVENYNEVENFIDILRPYLIKASEVVSDPEARETVRKSITELDRLNRLKDEKESIKSDIVQGRTELCNCDFTLAYGNTILLNVKLL